LLTYLFICLLIYLDTEILQAAHLKFPGHLCVIRLDQQQNARINKLNFTNIITEIEDY